jgi:hypothetical protein
MLPRAPIKYLAMLLMLGAAAGHAQENKEPASKEAPPTDTAPDAPPEDELLEFLGSVDSEDEDWNEYLAQTDPEKGVKND